MIAADKEQAAVIKGPVLTQPCYSSDSYFHGTLVLFHETVVISRDTCIISQDSSYFTRCLFLQSGLIARQQRKGTSFAKNVFLKSLLRRILGVGDHLFIVSVSSGNNYIVISGGHLS